MGLLDDLKKQAEIAKTQQSNQQSMRAETVKLVNERANKAFQYLNDLLKQLVVLKPENPTVFYIPGVGEIKGLGFGEAFIDFRRKRVNEMDVYDTVSFFIKWTGATPMSLERDMPASIQKVRDALWAVGIKFTEEEVKNDRGSLVKTRFNVPAAIVTDVVIRADYDAGRLVFATKNLARLGPEEFIVPAAEIDEGCMENFAKMLLGHPSQFKNYAGGLVRR